MSETTAPVTQTPAVVTPTDTTVGNYFVSNYPPFSFWKQEETAVVQKTLENAPKPNTPLGVYLHIPFCRKRCHFCYFRVYTDKDSTAIKAYIDAALKELDIYSQKPVIKGRKASFVYFGGGTPSYLSVDQLKQLTDGMKQRIPWDEAEEVTFECEPGTLTEHKLKALREIGVTRLSLGIENFDDHILEINGRAHRSKEVFRSFNYARELGFPQINVDLISGMVEETESNWKINIQKTIELSPDSVTIYQMEIPYNTTIYKEMKAAGKLVAPVADWETKRGWVKYAFEELEKAGYSISSAYTAVKNKEKTKFIYRDKLWAGADLLGLGVASFGHLQGTHFQNLHDFEPYLLALTENKLPIYRGLTPSNDERLIREFVLQLKLGQVSAEYFTKKFGINPLERFATPLRTIHDWGFGGVDGDRIFLNRDGLLQVDRLLHEFFLPEHRNARYA
ncbi:MAG: Coproporphyrinogen dehydrogenase [Verrucomicrobiales bacterium]|nr:Coproporphyrinogen dehydrogenase [Verrucomicrobiales bacterium]MDB6130784.1 Coproporphyrinogen dehydrogenase [Verrucomicrobiales bacterium]